MISGERVTFRGSSPTFSVRMAGLSPNSANIARTKRATQQVTHLVVHPEYEYWRPDWQKIRDAVAGEREIKRKGATYLRPMKGSDRDQYAEYLDRAVFYNMSAQTLNGMVGQVFRRPPVVRNLPKVGVITGVAADGTQEVISPGSDLETQLKRFAKDGTSHQGFAKTVASEQIAMGRFGALVDVAKAATNTSPRSYVVGYAAENIVDWTVEEVAGFYMVTRVLLREFERVDEHATPSQNNPWIGREGQASDNPRRAGARDRNAANRKAAQARPTRFTSSYTYRTIYRELCLEIQADGARIYKQYVYVEDPLGRARDTYTPTVRGVPLPFIPFVFFGSQSNAPDCEKPPLLDIVDLNIKHYRTYAELEYGRFFTALPTYYAPGNADNDAAEYHIGPGNVWEVPPDQIPGILEFKGEGLKTLERALNEKEGQIAAIGGRLMPGMSKSVSESDNQSALREANEQSLLLNVMMALEEGMTTLVRYWLMFRDVPLRTTEKLRYECDATFLTVSVDARTMRAIQQLYEAGILPVEGVYENFVRNGILPSSLSLEDFVAKLQNPDSFIGLPDVAAMRRGFASRQQELDQARLAREADFEESQQALDERRMELDEEKFDVAKKVDSTSVTATRKLGDPEQAPADAATKLQIKAQSDAAKQAAKARAQQPKIAPAPGQVVRTPAKKPAK
jgi:hypothetical protein